MPLQATSGAASYDAFGGGGIPYVPAYIEDVFSTYLYRGTGATQTITNNIDLSTKGGLVWIKCRGSALGHRLVDTARGTTYSLSSNTDTIQVQESTGLTAFGTTGFTIGADADYNTNNTTFASWTFQKKAKFFDVVTYTGNGVAGRQISHSLGSEVGCIIIKTLSVVGTGWPVWHRGISTQGAQLNATGAFESAYYSAWVDSTQPTSSVFTVGSDAGVNSNGETYVAYLFAHNAGGFGLTGTDNVISCGSFTTNAGGEATVTLGYEPQLILFKATDVAANWEIFDNMRAMPVDGTGQSIYANSTAAETARDKVHPTATGFTNLQGGAYSFIYIAIRRGPMKVPTTGTSVFGINARTGTGAQATVTGGQTDDFVIIKNRGAAQGALLASRLTTSNYLQSSSTNAETAAATALPTNCWDVMDGVKVGTTSAITNASSNTFINYLFKRAPSFMDVVAYTGDGIAGRNITHNLGVAPELILVKRRSDIEQWNVYCSALGATKNLILNTADLALTEDYWSNTTPTASVFTVNLYDSINASGSTYVAYLFATCAGVSKVGSYTGTATTKQIDCGFTSGARFVLIKRTDASASWHVWDTARGIVSGNDPYFLLNSTAAEVTTTDYIDTYSAGFELSSTAPAAINASGGNFIFLAIA